VGWPWKVRWIKGLPNRGPLVLTAGSAVGAELGGRVVARWIGRTRAVAWRQHRPL